jgi:hypothetical protein
MALQDPVANRAWQVFIKCLRIPQEEARVIQQHWRSKTTLKKEGDGFLLKPKSLVDCIEWWSALHISLLTFSNPGFESFEEPRWKVSADTRWLIRGW